MRHAKEFGVTIATAFVTALLVTAFVTGGADRWDAVSAVGSLSAVALALVLALRAETVRRKADEKAHLLRIQGVSFSLSHFEAVMHTLSVEHDYADLAFSVYNGSPMMISDLRIDIWSEGKSVATLDHPPLAPGRSWEKKRTGLSTKQELKQLNRPLKEEEAEKLNANAVVTMAFRDPDWTQWQVDNKGRRRKLTE